MNIEEMANISLQVEKPKKTQHYGVIRADNCIVSGRDGVGKTTFALSEITRAVSYNKKLIPYYIDADDKSPIQISTYAKHMKKLGGFYLNLHNIVSALGENKSLLGLVTFAATQTDSSKEYVFLIDNLSNITGEFENDNSLVTVVRTKMEKVLLKQPHIQTIVIAHSGKDLKGIRGASSFRSAFGEEIQLRKDIDFGIIAEVLKDSEDYHKTNLYNLDLQDKEEFIMKYTELKNEAICEDVAAYQSKRVDNIVISLIAYIKNEMKENIDKVEIVNRIFKQAIHLIATPQLLHTDDKDYITSHFVSQKLRAIYEKLAIVPHKAEDSKQEVFSVALIDLEKVAKGYRPITIPNEAKELLADLGYITIDSSPKVKKSLYDIKDLEDDIESLINVEDITGEGIRLALYKGKDAVGSTKYSSGFARDNITKALASLLKDKRIDVIVEGRKKTYTSVQALED